jgi:hypothetical protein
LDALPAEPWLDGGEQGALETHAMASGQHADRRQL